MTGSFVLSLWTGGQSLSVFMPKFRCIVQSRSYPRGMNHSTELKTRWNQSQLHLLKRWCVFAIILSLVCQYMCFDQCGWLCSIDFSSHVCVCAYAYHVIRIPAPIQNAKVLFEYKRRRGMLQQITRDCQMTPRHHCTYPIPCEIKIYSVAVMFQA